MFPLWFTLLGDFICLLGREPSILFLVFPPLFFAVLWLMYGWQGFIKMSSPLRKRSINPTLELDMAGYKAFFYRVQLLGLLSTRILGLDSV